MKINAVHVGVSGIPFGKSAAINRCLSVYNILNDNKFKIYAISRKASFYRDKDFKEINNKGIFSRINYHFTTPSPYVPNNLKNKIIYKIIGRVNEFFLIFKLGFANKIDIMFFYPQGFFFELIYYRIFSKLFNFPLVSHYVEYRSAIKYRNKFWQRVNDILFDKYFTFFVDGVIPISEFLSQKVIETRNLPLMKIPPIVDFDLFSKAKNRCSEKYFLYVGSSIYIESIQTIIKSFELIESNDYYLYLVLSGSGTNKIIKQLKEHPKKGLIEIYSNLEYCELLKYYKQAKGLLIPLSNSIQDRARFPNKISEYLASGNPIITSNFGEIKYYFKDQINALVVKNNDPKLISNKMNFIINSPKKAMIIGQKGYETGLKYFDNKSYRLIFKKFIFKLMDS